MSSRDPMWYCHQCHAEMRRPLMNPDPVCASCHGSFVEIMENPSDDPREFVLAEGDTDYMEPFLLSLRQFMERGANGARPGSQDRSRPTYSRPHRVTTIHFDNANGDIYTESDPPTMSEFIRTDSDGNTILTGPILAQYLASLLGNQGPLAPRLALFGGPPAHGRMGDYVFNQEALDQIVTQLLENSNANRPVPATSEIIANLSREVLLENSPLLEMDCAVCKEQFSLTVEDPSELVVVSLPCQHPFHEPCILPWLKTSGTCPVCRHALVPQPESHTPGPGPNSSRQGDSWTPRRDGGGNLFQTLFGGLNSAGGSNTANTHRSRNNNPNNSSSQHSRSNSEPSSYSSRRRGNSRDQLPGGWADDLD